MRAVEVRITGHVQGVSFRGWTAREAVRIELVGWVQNEADGAVLGHFEGLDDDVEEMVHWCHHGAPSAEVREVTVREVDPIRTGAFTVRY